MNEMQKRILGLLVEVDTICRENDIEYYLEGGAILGALRHGGFLPWDDDSDLAMTRDNWEKFKRVFFRLQPENRVLESPDLNIDYPTNTARYVDTSTTSIWRSLMYDVCACGVAVDIFILEDAPDDDELLEQQKRDFIDHCEIINPYYRLSSLGDGKRYSQLLERTREVGKKQVVEELDRKICQYNGSDSKRYLMRWGMRFQVYNKDIWGKPVYVPFEDTYLPIPQKPLDYLAYQYGMDWYMIPRESEQESHDTIRDLDVGYRTYMDEYMPLIDKEAALDLNFRYKIAEMQILDYNKAYHWHIYGTAGNACAQLLEGRLKKMGIDLDSAFAQVDMKTDCLFDDLFSDYLGKQLHQWFMFYRVYVPIADDTLACIISYLLRSGKGRPAEKLVDIRREQKTAPSEKLQRAIASYELAVESAKAFWSGRREEAVAMIRKDEKAALMPAQLAFCLYEDAGRCDGKDVSAMLQEIDSMLHRYPEEDLLLLTRIRLLQRDGNMQAAQEEAKHLLETSYHGMVRMLLLHGEEYAGLMQQADIH